MKEICRNCGMRYGLHIGWVCPGHNESFFIPTGEYEEETMNSKPYCAHSRVILKPIGTGGGAMKDTWQCEICGAYFIPDIKQPEGNMSNKIQMTEDQAREILDECACTETCDFKLDETISVMKQKGYILKSELQQKVERVEASLKDYVDGHSVDILDTFKASIDVIQLLKQSHPEFKEK